MIRGQFDYAKTPLAPAGMKVIVHDNTDERASWDKHGSRGFCIGTSLQHFRCYRAYMCETKSVRTSNTVEFFPSKCGNPLLTEGEMITLLLKDLVDILSKPTRTIPSITYGNELNNALRTMQELMCRNRDGTQRMGSERKVQQGVSDGFEPINVVEQRVGELASKGPKTRSQTFIQEEEGTIVRKKFCDGKYYEGEVVKYDPIN